jgi:DMSO/TMAO reductase YedYZ heme-binding membrane subunit
MIGTSFILWQFLCDKLITRWRTRVGRIVVLHTIAVYVHVVLSQKNTSNLNVEEDKRQSQKLKNVA